MTTITYHDRRANFAQAALEAYDQAKGISGPADEESARNLIQDLLHWIARESEETADFASGVLEEWVRLSINDLPRELEEDCPGCGEIKEMCECANQEVCE